MCEIPLRFLTWQSPNSWPVLINIQIKCSVNIFPLPLHIYTSPFLPCFVFIKTNEPHSRASLPSGFLLGLVHWKGRQELGEREVREFQCLFISCKFGVDWSYFFRIPVSSRSLFLHVPLCLQILVTAIFSSSGLQFIKEFYFQLRILNYLGLNFLQITKFELTIFPTVSLGNTHGQFSSLSLHRNQTFIKWLSKPPLDSSSLFLMVFPLHIQSCPSVSS